MGQHIFGTGFVFPLWSTFTWPDCCLFTGPSLEERIGSMLHQPSAGKQLWVADCCLNNLSTHIVTSTQSDQREDGKQHTFTPRLAKWPHHWWARPTLSLTNPANHHHLWMLIYYGFIILTNQQQTLHFLQSVICLCMVSKKHGRSFLLRLFFTKLTLVRLAYSCLQMSITKLF